MIIASKIPSMASWYTWMDYTCAFPFITSQNVCWKSISRVLYLWNGGWYRKKKKGYQLYIVTHILSCLFKRFKKVWWYSILFMLLQIPLYDQNQQWSYLTNKYCLCSPSLIYLILLLHRPKIIKYTLVSHIVNEHVWRNMSLYMPK